MHLTDPHTTRTIDGLFTSIIHRHLSEQAEAWLQAKAAAVKTEQGSMQLNMAFAQVPRITTKAALQLKAEEVQEVDALIPGLSVTTWSIDQLSRVWLLMQVPDADQDSYLKKINGLFIAAEMNELVALYAALPLLSYPQEWSFRCTEGIRSNIGTVLEAIMYHNPYPFRYLPETAWNQLVLKAFFTEKDVELIYGLMERNNKALQQTLKDYVEERDAAGRTINPWIHRLIKGQ